MTAVRLERKWCAGAGRILGQARAGEGCDMEYWLSLFGSAQDYSAQGLTLFDAGRGGDGNAECPRTRDGREDCMSCRASGTSWGFRRDAWVAVTMASHLNRQ